MISIKATKDADDRIRYIEVSGHSEDSAVCASVSMAVAISRKLLGGTDLDYAGGGGAYRCRVPMDQRGDSTAIAILASLARVAKAAPELEVNVVPRS